MVLCFVPFCSNRTEGFGRHSFHKFPQSDIRKRQWLRAMKRDKNGEYFLNHSMDELSIKSSTKICSAHFKPLDFIYHAKKKTLSSIAVPSIFKWTSKTDLSKINKETDNSHKKDHKACFVPCDCCQIVIEEIPEDYDSEVEEIIIEREINDDGAVNHCITNTQDEQTDNKEDIKQIIDEKPEITKIDITEENMASLLDFDIKEEYLDIPCDTNPSDLAQLGYCAEFVANGNDTKYNNDVTACYTDLVSYNCDVTDYTEDPTNENNDLTYCASANSADVTEPVIKKSKHKQKGQSKNAFNDLVTYNCDVTDYTEDTTNENNELMHCASANSAETAFKKSKHKKKGPSKSAFNDLVPYNCNVTDYTEDPTNENNELIHCANSAETALKKSKHKQKVQPNSAFSNYPDIAPYNCDVTDYTEDPTNGLTYCASAEPAIRKDKHIQKILQKKTGTLVENIRSLQHIKAHIIHKEQILAKCNFGSDNPSLTGNPTLGIPIFTIERFKAHDQSIEYYTGLPSYDLMQLIFTYVLPSSNADHVYYATKNARLIRNYNLSGMNQFFMTVLRLKRNFDIKLITDLFSVNETIVHSVFRAWIQYLHNRLSQLIRWPNRENLIKTQKNVIGGLYITKLTTEKECKKGLIMLDPNFNLIFVSKLFPDHLTVRELMQQSFFLREITRKFELEELRGTDVIITGDRMLEVRSFVKWKETDDIDIVVVEVTDCKKKNLAMLTEERMNVKQVYEKLNIYAILKSYDSSLYETYFFNEVYTVCMFLSFFQLI